MCGIVGYIGKPVNEERKQILKEMLQNACNRGQDGWGFLAYRPGKGALVWKDSVSAGKADLDKELDILGATVVLGHTRARTSGSMDSVDCHPLAVGNVAVIHNGVINNHASARNKLGIGKDTPQVDSYLIPHIIHSQPTIMEGIETALKELWGSLTFLVFSTRSPMTLWAASNLGNNLFHFRMGGNDYFASTEEIFENSVASADSWGLSFPAYKKSWGLHGIFEVSPHTIKVMRSKEEVDSFRTVSYSSTTYEPLNRRTSKGTALTMPPQSGDANIPLKRVQDVLKLGRGSQNEAPTQDELVDAIAHIRVIMTDGTLLSKKMRKRLTKRYNYLMVKLNGYGANLEYDTISETEPKRDCDVCKVRPAESIYHDMDLCSPCLISFLDK